ncbi:MAG: O-methyltransferase [Solirubrobacteraceae bacterium]
MKTLCSPRVAAVLDRLSAAGRREDEQAKVRMRERAAQLGRPLDGSERAELCRDAPIAVTPQLGELLYVLTLASGARQVVEFGTSLGFSAIHLAAAIQDAGNHGTLTTTELDERKAHAAVANIDEAGFAELVDVRTGDARTTLAHNPGGPIDLLFLDGWNELYLGILALIQPRLRAGALVIADLSANDPACDAYRVHLDEPTRGYATVTLPLDAGVTVSVRRPAARTHAAARRALESMKEDRSGL